ncbi:MAG: hypothetical protein OEW67_11800, partial [Cyclobacteriaceae bacterium]|nr:hypothetical protein [Cyclobacteriaceae bacterium]
MKYYSVLTVVVLLFFINISWGQIEKNNNVIIITGGYSTAENFDVTAKYLINNGFTFETINKEYNQMVTNPKSYAGAFNYKLIVNFENKIVFIRASLQ